MAVTLEQIATWLDGEGFKFDHDKERDFIFFGVSGGDNIDFAHFIRTKENGEMFDWQMQIVDKNKEMLNIKGHVHTDKILSYILLANYNTKFGTWEYDPADGDIRLVVEIPLEDAVMTQKQFKRIKSLFEDDEIAQGILHIMETGEFPEKRDREAEMLAKLEALLAALKEGSDSSSDSSEDAI